MNIDPRSFFFNAWCYNNIGKKQKKETIHHHDLVEENDCNNNK